MFFATSILHVHVMQWDSTSLVEESVNGCNLIWESLEPEKVSYVFTFSYVNISFSVFHFFPSSTYQTSPVEHEKKLGIKNGCKLNTVFSLLFNSEKNRCTLNTVLSL